MGGHRLKLDGSVAVVTGGGGAIGSAIGRALHAAGGTVILADLDEAAAKAAADSIGDRATGRAVDVTDAGQVDALVESAFLDHGRLDLMINNAGVGVAGDAAELIPAHWDRSIDVNIRGVTNGVAAAYPRMVEQGHGHILNMASLAGLTPLPFFGPYATTKFAIVGLSLSLRGEAADRGVSVSVVCPAAVDTPLLDSSGPPDLPRPWAPNIRAYLTDLGGPPIPPDELATEALKGIRKNKALIIPTRQARMVWRMGRFAPRLIAWLGRREVRKARAEAGTG